LVPAIAVQGSDDASGIRSDDAASHPFGGRLGLVDATPESILRRLRLPLGLAAVPPQPAKPALALLPQGSKGTAASIRATPLRLTEAGRRAVLQARELATGVRGPAQGVQRVGCLLTPRDGGSDRCVGEPLRLPSE
jgi:hypothetical protein